MKALVIVVRPTNKKGDLSYEYEAAELKSLLYTYSIKDADTLMINIDRINPSLYIGSGKAFEIKEMIVKEGIKLVVFNVSLTPAQQRNLSESWDVDVMDKSLLIIRIFKQRAKTMEGKLQVELADLKYNLSRLSGYGKSMDQQYGVVGIRGGSGERKIEYDRRKLRERISLISKNIEKIRKSREVKREKRLSIPLPVVSIVGYTNAGKSTLINSLSGKDDVYADNRLFATLDPTSRRVRISGNFFAIFTDTVGFINNLPHLLIMAFSSTLEEIKYSDIIIHLHDLTADIKGHNEVVKKTLAEIGASDIPIINVFNKIDIINDLQTIKERFNWLDPVFISASKKQGLDELLKKVEEKLGYRWKNYTVKLNNYDTEIIDNIRKHFFITGEGYKKDQIIFNIKSTQENINRLKNLKSIVEIHTFTEQ